MTANRKSSPPEPSPRPRMTLDEDLAAARMLGLWHADCDRDPRGGKYIDPRDDPSLARAKRYAREVGMPDTFASAWVAWLGRYEVHTFEQRYGRKLTEEDNAS